jgi:hypothetical protein
VGRSLARSRLPGTGFVVRRGTPLHSFGYFVDAEERLVLRKIYDALVNGGRFLIEILDRDWLLKNFSDHAEKVVDGGQDR